MEGPTPVSAMIHAATMVSAGVYLALRIFPLLAVGWVPGHPTLPMMIITFIGTFTALFAATIAVAQNDIKRVLAYSTISQLGFMVAAIGIGAYIAAAFHLVMHAFFKALLFLDSGSVIHGMEHGVFHTGKHIDPQDMFNMGGLRKKMPITFWTFLIGGFALSGFPLITAGFWSKDEILAEAFAGQHFIVLTVLSLAAALTGFYTMRQITMTFLGTSRTEAAHHAVESKASMTLPLIVLAVASITAGWAGISKNFPLIGGLLPNWIHDFVGSTLLQFPEELPFNVVPLLISILVSLGGLFVGWFIYRNLAEDAVDPLEKALGPVYTVLQKKYYFDEFYDWAFVRPSIWLAETFVSVWVDRRVIDGFLHWIARITSVIGTWLRTYIDKMIINGFGDLVGESVKKFGRSARVIQSGRIQQYMISALVTIAIFSAIFYYLLVLRP
jgi:NADH-quinone oxidoreductase subunit L